MDSGGLWTRWDFGLGELCGMRETVWTRGDPVDSRGACGLGDPVDSGGPCRLGDWGAGAECPPGMALPVDSSGLCLALSSPCPGNHGGPEARARAGAAASGEGRSCGPRSALPALPQPPPGPCQPKHWRAALRGAPGPHGKSSRPQLLQEVREVEGNKGAEGLEAVQTAPRRDRRQLGAAGSVARKGRSPLTPLGAACSVHHPLFTSSRPRPAGGSLAAGRSAPGPSQGRDHRHPGWPVLVLLVGGDVGTPRSLEAQEA